MSYNEVRSILIRFALLFSAALFLDGEALVHRNAVIALMAIQLIRPLIIWLKGFLEDQLDSLRYQDEYNWDA